MNCLTTITNLLGLAFDIIGAVLLFRIKQGSLKKLSFSTHRFDRISGGSVDSKINSFASEIRQSIADMHRQIESNDKKASRYFILILIGFALQFISTILNAF